MKIIKKQLAEDLNDAIRYDDDGEALALKKEQSDSEDYAKLAKVFNNSLEQASKSGQVSKAGVYASVESDGVVIDCASTSDIPNILDIVRSVVKLNTARKYEITIYGNEIVVSHSGLHESLDEDYHASEFDNYDDDVEEADIDRIYHDASEDELRSMGAFDNLNDDDDFDWDAYEQSLELSDDTSDAEADREHTNLYGGDRTYCDVCDTRLVYDEDGYTYCPKCKAESSDDITEDVECDIVLTEAEKKYKPHTQRLLKLIRSSKVEECATSDTLEEEKLDEVKGRQFKPSTIRLLKMIGSDLVSDDVSEDLGEDADKSAYFKKVIAETEEKLRYYTKQLDLARDLSDREDIQRKIDGFNNIIRINKQYLANGGKLEMDSLELDQADETLGESVDYDSPIEVLKDRILLVDEIYDMAQISGPVVTDVTSLSDEETIQLAKDMLADGDERIQRSGKPIFFLTKALHKLKLALDDCTTADEVAEV